MSEFDIQEELKKLPSQPGVYLMHDASDEIIYIGKAVNLKNRVRQYFQSSRNKSEKIRQMVSHIARFEYIITDSELEALVLECNLIKEHRPRYNTMLKDDKAYPYIKVTTSEEYPRVLFSRTMKKDKNRYFGPYTSAFAVKETINLIHKLYRIRTCTRSLPKDIGKERPCLNYHIGQCDAPCQGYISKEDYAKNVAKALDFLNGHYEPILSELEQKMQAASDNLDFEKAGEYRDLLSSVRQVAQKQKMTSSDEEDRDIIAMARDDRDAVVQVFFMREGKLIGREHFHLSVGAQERSSEILGSFIKQFYTGTPFLPRELWLQEEPEDAELIADLLSSLKGSKVRVVVPKAGQKEKMIELAQKNAGLVLSQDKENIKKEEIRTCGAVKEIASLLGIEDLHRMESFDISNISGYETVGCMVVYEDGKPKRSDYRKFRVRTVSGPDDYAAMREVLMRRFSRGLEEKKKIEEEGLAGELGRFSHFPDLILMDGGKGQVNAAEEVLDELGLDIPVCGMVKDDSHRTRGLYFHNEEVPIDHHSEGFALITRIQDEVHRFAIEYHRSLRGKDQVHSVLDDIPGIGPSRRKALMRTYPSLDAIREASEEELAAIPGMNRAAAENVYRFFREDNSKEDSRRPM